MGSGIFLHRIRLTIKKSREVAIAKAIRDGYTQISIGNYLGLSNIAVSKVFKRYKEKVQLFNKLRDKGLFWSYSKDIEDDNIDYLEPVESLDKKKIRNFFQSELQKLKNHH